MLHAVEHPQLIPDTELTEGRSAALLLWILSRAVLPAGPNRAGAGTWCQTADQTATGLVIRLIVPVVLWPACTSTNNTVPPQLCTMSAPTTLSMV